MAQEKDVVERLNFAREIALEAGKFTLDYFCRSDLQIDRKKDETPVTAADRGAEQLLRDRISKRFSTDAILGEEFGEQAGSTAYQWIVDPIDGTKSFIHGVPLYANLVAVLRDGQPLIGVVNVPALGQQLYATKGGGCWYIAGPNAEAKRSQVSTISKLSESLFLTSEVVSFTTQRKEDTVDVYLKLQRAARLSRTWGDAYGYLMVATGRAEIMIDPVAEIWDLAPLQTVVEEAGGFFCDWEGKPSIRSRESIGTNGRVTEEVLAVTRGR